MLELPMSTNALDVIPAILLQFPNDVFAAQQGLPLGGKYRMCVKKPSINKNYVIFIYFLFQIPAVKSSDDPLQTHALP